MAVVVGERPGSRRVTVSVKNPSAEFLVVAQGSTDSVEVRDAIIAYLPKWYANLVLLIDTLDIEPQGDGYITYGTAKYGLQTAGVNPSTGAPIDGQGNESQPPDPPEQSGTQTDDTPLGPEVAWETAGGTVKLQKSFEVVSSHIDPFLAIQGGQAPDNKGAIGLSKDGVEGVDVPAPQFSWSATYRFAFVTRKYLMTLRRLTGTVNKFEWLGRKVREVRFDGSSGRIGSDGKVEATFRFSEQETQYDATAGDILIPEIKGWDYLDVGFGPSVDATWLIETPVYAHVHRIYRQSDFRELGIG